MIEFYKGKRILFTGAIGTVGKELVGMDSSEPRLVDNNESEIFFLMEEYRDLPVHCFLGDVRDRQGGQGSTRRQAPGRRDAVFVKHETI